MTFSEHKKESRKYIRKIYELTSFLHPYKNYEKKPENDEICIFEKIELRDENMYIGQNILLSEF